MAPGGQVQRKWCGYFTQVMYADRTEAPERGSYEAGLLVPPPSWSFLFFPLSRRLSLREWGTCHWLWGLWEVTIFGTFEMFTPKKGGGVGATTKILWIFHSGSTRCPIPPSQTQEREEAVLINNPRRSWRHLRKHVTNQLLQAVVWLWLAHLSQLIRKGCSDVAAELSPGLTCEKQVVQLPTSGSRQARLCCLRACMNIRTCTSVFL